MEKRRSNRRPKGEPRHFFDILTEQHILGEAALDVHFNAGGHPSDVVALPELLADASIVIPKKIQIEGLDWSKETNESYVSSMVWLGSLMLSAKSQRVTELVVTRANRLGLIGSKDQIRSPKRFKKLAHLYTAARLTNTIRKGAFEDKTDAELGRAIKRVHTKKGRTPTWDDLEEESRKDPTVPRPGILKERYGALRTIMERHNLIPHRPWEGRPHEDFIDWGIMFAEANEGMTPSQIHLRFFSRWEQFGKYAAPPVPTTIRKFGSFGKFQIDTMREFTEKQRTEKVEKARKISAIQEGLESGRLPGELFEDCANEREAITRYAKYLVVRNLDLPLDETAVKLCIEGLGGRDFIPSIRKRVDQLYDSAESFSAGDIELTANYLHVFEDIWPSDTHLQALRAIDNPDFLEFHNAYKNKENTAKARRKKASARRSKSKKSSR